MRYKGFQNAIQRFHAHRKDTGAERFFRNRAMLFLQTKSLAGLIDRKT
jgi:hypothetical protein